MADTLQENSLSLDAEQVDVLDRPDALAAERAIRRVLGATAAFLVLVGTVWLLGQCLAG